MPYAPGVQDRRGEFLAHGISQAFDSLAGGIQQYQKAKEEAKDIQAKGKEGKSAVELFSSLVGWTPERTSMETTRGADETDRQYAIRMAGLAKNMVVSQEMKQMKLQAEAYAAQLAESGAKMQEMERQRNHLIGLQNMARLANGPAMVPSGNVPTSAQGAQGAVPTFTGTAQSAGGAGRGVIAAPVQRQMMQQMSDPMMNTTARAALATGQLPSANVAVADDQRRLLAETRALVEKAKLDAKNQGPKFHTDPTTGMVVAVYNGQMMPVRSPKEDDNYREQLDEAVRNKVITPEERAKYWKGFLQKKAEWSPNNLQTLIQQAGGIPAPTAPSGAASPAAQPAPGTPAVLVFATVEEATAARKAGKIKDGDKITVGGKPATWKD